MSPFYAECRHTTCDGEGCHSFGMSVDVVQLTRTAYLSGLSPTQVYLLVHGSAYAEIPPIVA